MLSSCVITRLVVKHAKDRLSHAQRHGQPEDRTYVHDVVARLGRVQVHVPSIIGVIVSRDLHAPLAYNRDLAPMRIKGLEP